MCYAAVVNAVVFDTLKLAKRLESAGFTREQASGAAEALAEGLTGDLATKADLAAVRAEIASLKSEVASLKSELRGEIAALRIEMDGRFARLGGELRSEMAAMQLSLVRWIVGAVVLNVASIAGLVFVVLRFVRP